MVFFFFFLVFSVSLVGIATAGVGFPPKARDISFLHSVQTGSGAHPASYLTGTEGFLARGAGAKRRIVKLTAHLHQLPR
jgi:hypothetical protein